MLNVDMETVAAEACWSLTPLVDEALNASKHEAQPAIYFPALMLHPERTREKKVVQGYSL